MLIHRLTKSIFLQEKSSFVPAKSPCQTPQLACQESSQPVHGIQSNGISQWLYPPRFVAMSQHDRPKKIWSVSRIGWGMFRRHFQVDADTWCQMNGISKIRETHKSWVIETNSLILGTAALLVSSCPAARCALSCWHMGGQFLGGMVGVKTWQNKIRYPLVI